MKALEKKFLYRSLDGPGIIIIGAGVAGLAAASRLLRNGYKNVKIIEAENRIGGRVHSVSLGNCTVDLGAHWVHGENGNVVYELAKPSSLVGPSGDFSSVHFVVSNGTEIETEVGMKIYCDASDLLDDIESLKNTKGSLYDYMIKRCTESARQRISGEVLTAFMDWLVTFECTIEGCNSLKEPSAKGLVHYKRCDGDQTNDWKGKGYKSVLDLLLGTPAERSEVEERVYLNNEVDEIDYSGVGVTVKCKSGETYTGDYAILTVSLGVLKHNYQTLFKPSLPPEKRKAIVGLGIGTVNKVYLKFENAWWPKNCSGFSLLWLPQDKHLEEGQFPWEKELIGFYTESSSPTTLTGWLVGEAARDMECFTPRQVKEGCYRVLKNFLGKKFEIPEPEDIVRSSWFSNPHFRGSYSFRSMNSDALVVYASNLAQPLKNFMGREVVMFAGEATHDYFYSTVHGAIETGWREADNLIALDRRALKSSKLQSSL